MKRSATGIGLKDRVSPSPRTAWRGPARAVAIGGSAGGPQALVSALAALSPDFALPILVVQHLHFTDAGRFAEHLGRLVPLPVIEPCDKEPIKGGTVYTAPANYHMLVERDGTISLSVDAKVNWSRPSMDVLFESAARVWGSGLVAVVLSGANRDGARGLAAVRRAGGMTLAQDPGTADCPIMPQASIDAGVVDEVLPADEIGRRLLQFAMSALPVAGANGCHGPDTEGIRE
jgi:two-component system chemotaxis response regulator CheB